MALQKAEMDKAKTKKANADKGTEKKTMKDKVLEKEFKLVCVSHIARNVYSMDPISSFRISVFVGCSHMGLHMHDAMCSRCPDAAKVPACGICPTLLSLTATSLVESPEMRCPGAHPGTQTAHGPDATKDPTERSYLQNFSLSWQLTYSLLTCILMAQIQEFMLDLVPEATKGPTDGRNGDHMALVLSIVYNSTELTLADIQRALAASKPSDEVCLQPWPLRSATGQEGQALYEALR